MLCKMESLKQNIRTMVQIKIFEEVAACSVLVAVVVLVDRGSAGSSTAGILWMVSCSAQCDLL